MASGERVDNHRTPDGLSTPARSDAPDWQSKLARGYTRRRLVDKLVVALAALSVALALVPLVSIVWYVAVRGGAAINLAFFTQTPAPLGQPGGGMLHALVGSGIMVGIGMAIALPVAILTGVFLAEFGDNALGETLRVVVDLLNGMPSVVVGVLVYTLMVVRMGHYSAWAGAVALGIMALPLIIRTTETLLAQVPGSLREAGLALGLPQWRVIMRVVIPTARAGITTGVLLALARIAGETAPLLFTALGNDNLSYNMGQPMASLTVTIYNYALSAYDTWHQLAWGAALVLVGLVFLINLIARWLIRGPAISR